MAGLWVITPAWPLSLVQAQAGVGDALGGLPEQLRGVEPVPAAGDQQGRGGDAVQLGGGVEGVLGGHRDQHVGGIIGALAGPEATSGRRRRGRRSPSPPAWGQGPRRPAVAGRRRSAQRTGAAPAGRGARAGRRWRPAPAGGPAGGGRWRTAGRSSPGGDALDAHRPREFLGDGLGVVAGQVLDGRPGRQPGFAVDRIDGEVPGHGLEGLELRAAGPARWGWRARRSARRTRPAAAPGRPPDTAGRRRACLHGPTGDHGGPDRARRPDGPIPVALPACRVRPSPPPARSRRRPAATRPDPSPRGAGAVALSCSPR